MYRLLALATVIGLQSCSFCKAPTASTASEPTSSSPIASTKIDSGKDVDYEIRWEGPQGKQITAKYSILYRKDNQPNREEELKISLPYSVKFKAPQKAYVSGFGYAYPEVDFNIKIFRDGKECSKAPNVVSSTVKPSKYRDCDLRLGH
jgi:hypothetical protein